MSSECLDRGMLICNQGIGIGDIIGVRYIVVDNLEKNDSVSRRCFFSAKAMESMDAPWTLRVAHW